MGRPFLRNVFHKSTLSSLELEGYGGFDFGGAKFDLIFKNGVNIRAKSGEPKITVNQGRQPVLVTKESGSVSLEDNDQIIVGRCAAATIHMDIPES